MAIGLASNMKVFPDQFQAGYVEVLSQNSNAFNALSAGAMLLFPAMSRGHFSEEAFTQVISGLVNRRDITSTSAQTATAITQGSFIEPKLSRKVKEIAVTLDALRKADLAGDINQGMAVLSFTLGQQIAQAVILDYLNTGVLCLTTTLLKQATTNTSLLADSTTTLNYTGLIKGLKLMGDRGNGVVAWLMHSKGYYDLLGQSVGIVTDRIAGLTIYEGTAGTMGRPVVVTDSDNLVKADGVTTGTDSYYALGLTASSLRIKETEQLVINDEVKNGAEQIYMSIQGEHAYNVGVKGFSYTGGLTNPDDTELGTTSKWTLASASIKDAAGFLIEHS